MWGVLNWIRLVFLLLKYLMCRMHIFSLELANLDVLRQTYAVKYLDVGQSKTVQEGLLARQQRIDVSHSCSHMDAI